MDNVLLHLITRMNGSVATEKIIPWSCPVPVFGDSSRAIVATLGLNPSKREFVDDAGVELEGPRRRLHTLKSLELTRWSDATTRHVEQIDNACREYFSLNPYHGWFRSLDAILAGAGFTYYGARANACHLDLIPYAGAIGPPFFIA